LRDNKWLDVGWLNEIVIRFVQVWAHSTRIFTVWQSPRARRSSVVLSVCLFDTAFHTMEYRWPWSVQRPTFVSLVTSLCVLSGSTVVQFI